MTSTGLLVLSNAKNINKSLSAIKNYVKNVYIHLNIPQTSVTTSPANWSRVISRIYSESFSSNPEMDVKILVSPLKKGDGTGVKREIDMLFADGRNVELCEAIRAKHHIRKQAIFLTDDETNDLEPNERDEKMYDTVVLGGTFDRIHVGHKIFLAEAVLRCCKRLVVGVTDENMIKSKKLWELILPVEQRIQDVRDFLTEIDCTLQYDVVPIQDAYGPTKVDPDMDMIIVSAETIRGGEKVNEVRLQAGLKPLEIHCIDLIEENEHDGPKETKVSSSNMRIDLLGTRLRAPEARPHLPARPYVIGLTGGIASGKSKMAHRFQLMGAHVLDCDKIAHDIYEPGQVCYEKIIQHFGEDILDENRRINRQKLGPKVFGNPRELETLNQIVWPELILEAKRRIANIYEESKVPVVILEAAVLLKAGWETECHEVWSMIVSPDEAVKRVVERNNLSEEEVRKRLASQLDNKTIVDKSNVVFSSEWKPEYTHKQAEKAWQMLMSELGARSSL